MMIDSVPRRSILALTFSLRAFAMMMIACVVTACASLPDRDPVQVQVAGIEPLPGEGMEMRMLVKLRVQNPNNDPVDYDGIYLKLEVQDRAFATGVSDERGTVPRYGEALVSVPMTVSTLRMMSNIFGMLDGKPVDKVRYKLYGKLDGPGLGSTRFELQGDFAAPTAPAPRFNP